MKKILTKKEFLNERAVSYDPQHPERMHPSLERSLSTGSHSLGGHPAFPPTTGGQSFEEKLASQRFQDVVSKVKRYSGKETIDQGVLMQALNALKTVLSIEKEHKEELEKIAIKLVKKEFGLKDEIDLIPEMGETPDIGDMKIDEPEDEYEPEDVEDMEGVEGEVKKRRLVNAMIQGASKKGHYMFHLVESELNRIDPRLINLYGLVMSIGDYQYWMIDDDTIRQVIEQTKVGKVTTGVTGDEKDPREETEEESKEKKHYVRGEGLIFPVVVHELIKGVMEVMSLPSLPENPKVREYVLSKTDFVMGENWDLRLGPGIWEKFLESIDESSWDVKHYLYQEIIKMPTNEFNSFMKELLGGTQKGKRELAKLAGEIKQDIVADKYDQSEYERKKAEKEKSSKEVEDDFMRQIRDMLKPRNPNEDNL
jgi:hypothetical protein